MTTVYNDLINPKLINQIRQGDIGIIPTDTVYGMTCLASNPLSVEKLYKIRERDKDKPLIILVDTLDRINEFGVALFPEQRALLEKIYPAPFTVLIKHLHQNKFKYLYGTSNYLSFRIPTNLQLCKLIRNVGPLVAPSANPQGLNPAKNIKQAKEYFGETMDFYVDNGELDNLPSTIGVLTEDKFDIIRQGSYFLPQNLIRM
jgi:L-threonylcarbamoyladenylate synthase